MLTKVVLNVYPITNLDKFVSAIDLDLDLDLTQFGDVGLDFMLEDHPIFKELCLC